MPNIYHNLYAEVASPDSNITNMTQCISVSVALKLAAPFKGVKTDNLEFTANVDTVFEVNDPRNEGTLFKFVLTRISGLPRTAIMHKNLENWEELKEIIKNTYT
jgi:hypothetical protein